VLTLSQEQRDRLVLLRQWQEGLLTGVEAAERLGLSARHFRRLCRRWEAEGDSAVVRREPGRRGNPQYGADVRAAVLDQAAQPLYRDFGPTLLSEHAPGAVPSWTVRRWMIEAGLWEVRVRRRKHRRRRPRRARYGELVLMDTSEHDWLEGRAAETMVLIAMIDDATNDLHARFFPRDTGVANQWVIMDWLQSRGRMGALYTDQASHFSQNANGTRTQSAIRRGLEAMGVELILALSPEAKGRVERLFGTLQDRLIKEMRVAEVSSMAEANLFLEECFLPFWRRRFRVEPTDFTDAHLPLETGTDLLRLFAEVETRVIAKDFTIRYRNQFWQIIPAEADPRMPLRRVHVEERPDGTMHFRWEERYVHPVLLAADRQGPEPVRWKPGPNHPLKRRFYGSIDKPVAARTTAIIESSP
jgi:hypothetical protein